MTNKFNVNRINVYLTPDVIKMIDELRVLERPIVSRSEVIKRLIRADIKRKGVQMPEGEA